MLCNLRGLTSFHYEELFYRLIVMICYVIRRISITVITIIIMTIAVTILNRSMWGWQSAYENTSTWNRWSVANSKTSTTPLHIITHCEERSLRSGCLPNVALDLRFSHGTWMGGFRSKCLHIWLSDIYFNINSLFCFFSFICLLFIYLFIYICLFIYLFIYLCLFIDLYVYLFIYIFICEFIHLFFNFFFAPWSGLVMLLRLSYVFLWSNRQTKRFQICAPNWFRS